MVAIVAPATTMNLDTITRMVECWNADCGKGQRLRGKRKLFEVRIQGAMLKHFLGLPGNALVISLPCPRCGDFNLVDLREYV